MSPPAPRRALFALVIFTGSFLLFLVQPLVARQALPLLGGAPNVWNSAMVVFQTLLLGGYAYAHALSRLPLRRQALIHIALLAFAALTLPIALPHLPPAAAGWEALWVPALFALAVGPAFVLVSAQASLMQRWYFAAPGAGNPYPLYAASNLGSFAGLLTYPLWLEPTTSLSEQSRVWTLGYLALIALVAVAAWARWNTPAEPRAEDAASREPVARSRVLLWLALAAVPSGLVLSTTTLLTTDVMAMPLLWVIPLGLYLLSFPVAFSATGDWARILGKAALVLLLALGGLAMSGRANANPAVAIGMVGLLFVLSVALHARLYATRPEPARLTFFYLIVAAGGAIGGMFTALLAPLLFDWVYEHAILLLAAALLLPQHRLLPYVGRLWDSGARRTWLAPALVALAAVLAWQLSLASLADGTLLALALAILLVGLVLLGVRWAYAAVLALLMLGYGGVTTLEASARGDRSRSYFGVYTVELDARGALRRLAHGTTTHGQQWLDPARRREPTSYYGRGSGIGIALAGEAADARIGVVGLGAGTLACYRQPGQDWTFFEIDPAVLRYSRDRTFTFLADCAPEARIVLGDARLQLAARPAGQFDLLAVDAFSSDAIPLHLMTAEAFATYGRALADDGLLLVHISNRYLDLAPVVAAQARAGGWHGRMRVDERNIGPGMTASLWIALSRSPERLAQMEGRATKAWSDLPPPARRTWTDENASILPLIRW
jgi:SAM-dependent methyltransferase